MTVGLLQCATHGGVEILREFEASISEVEFFLQATRFIPGAPPPPPPRFHNSHNPPHPSVTDRQLR